VALSPQIASVFARWSVIEKQLDQVHTLITDADVGARTAFDQLKGWDRRKMAIAAAATQHLSPQVADYVKAVLRLAEPPASKRNELAHGVWATTTGYESYLTLLSGDHQHTLAQAAVAAKKAGTSRILLNTNSLHDGSRLVSRADLDRLIGELEHAKDRLEALIYGHLYADFLDVTGNGFADYRARLDSDPEIQEPLRNMARERKRAQKGAKSSLSNSSGIDKGASASERNTGLAATPSGDLSIGAETTHAIRSARPEDAEDISALIVAALREANAKDYSEAVIQRVEQSFSPDAVRALMMQRVMFVATLGERILGTASLDGRVVRTVFVEPGYQGKGIGRRLMAEVEREALARGVALLAVPSSVTAEPFYAKLGFRAVRDAYHGEERTIVMERSLAVAL
jgi:predicted N-acetyltransferase YhbS